MKFCQIITGKQTDYRHNLNDKKIKMKNITLIRHGKSGYDFELSDKQRILTEKGIEKSILVAKEYLPNLPIEYYIKSSAASRAQMTAKIFAKVFSVSENKIEISEDLYTFDGQEFRKIIEQTDNNINNLIVFGHNDAITDFVNNLGSIPIDNVPTSGLVSIDFNVEKWSQIQKGKTIKTIFPREI